MGLRAGAHFFSDRSIKLKITKSPSNHQRNALRTREKMMKDRETTVSDYILSRLWVQGIREIFLLPGGGAMHLNDSLARSRIKAIPCHHEQACGIAAEAYGRGDTKGGAGYGVAMVTTGPGTLATMQRSLTQTTQPLPLRKVSGIL